MATEIMRWCDVCMTSDERVPGAAHALQLDSKAGTLDLCAEHVKVLLSPLLDMLTTAATPSRATTDGRRGGGRRPEPGDAQCLLCPSTYRAERMAAHLSKTHGKTQGAVYGLACPLCDFEPTTGRIMGLANHARHEHDASGIVDLWVRTDQAGDPDGKIAQRRLVLAGRSA